MVQIDKQSRKKKGRPSKADLLARRTSAASPATESEKHRHLRRTSGSSAAESDELRDNRRRSLRRRSFRYNIIDYDEDYLEDDDEYDAEFFEDEEDDVEDRETDEDEDEDERRRREKKVKLVVKLSSSTERVDASGRAKRRGRVGHADSEEEDEEERDVKKKKRRRISGSRRKDCDVYNGENDNDDDEENEDENGEDCDDDEGRDGKVESKRGHGYSFPGTPVASTNRSWTPLPDKKQLELILDELQKKDTYGVYAEPVDPEELPDYHDIIKHPMDFSTLRKKLANGSYSTLEQFESDVFLISSNAMQYNAPDTIYHKQARAIKELAERKFQRSRTRIDRLSKESKLEVQCEPKSEQKPELREKPKLLVKKLSKKPSCRSAQEPVCSDFSSGATLATVSQNTYSADHVGMSERHSINDGPVEGISFLVDNCIEKAEDLHSGKCVLPKFGRRSFIDENRRDTYLISNQPVDRSDSIFIPFEDEKKQLIPVGLPGEYSYSRSLTRFAANLGPIAWKIASKRIEQVLPPGFKYGRGWVGEYEPLSTTEFVLKDRKEYPLASRSHDVIGSAKNGKRPGCIASGKEHISKQPTFDGNMASIFASEGSKLHSPTVSVTQQQNLVLRASGGPENMMLRRSGLSCPSPNNQTNGAAFAKRIQLPQDSVCTEYTGPHTVERNSSSVSNQKTNYISSRHTPGSREMDSREVKQNCAPVSIKKTDHVSPKQPSGGMETPSSRHVESMHDGKKILQSFSIKQSDSNGGAPEGLCDGKSTNNFVDSNRVILSSPGSIPSQLSGAAAFFPQKQDHGLNDPVLVMKMLAEKAQRQQNGSADARSPLQARLSIPSPRGDGGSNAAAAAANAWMSVGAVGYRPAALMPSGNRGQISNDQLHSGKQVFYPQAMQSNVEYPVPTTTHFQAFLQQPTKGSNEPQNQNRSMAFPPMSTNDLSRFQVHASWRGLNPRTQQKQKQDTLPPDLNVAFQSVDSQQPDLALQL